MEGSLSDVNAADSLVKNVTGYEIVASEHMFVCIVLMAWDYKDIFTGLPKPILGGL